MESTFSVKPTCAGVLPGRLEALTPLTRNPSHCAPRVGVIIPLTGDNPVMKACLESLLDQSYSNYEVIFVTCNSNDPAVQIVNQVIQTKKNARHIVSGAASGCSQKNHNLLAGLADLDSSIEILVFCDSTHWAPQHFLTDLVSPIVSGKAVMTTGFHRVVPGDCRLPTLGMLVSVMAIHLMQGIESITQPWGGATAISRRTFEENRVSALWAENVVDDVSMYTLLAKAGIRVRPVSSACLLTPIRRRNLSRLVWMAQKTAFLSKGLPAGHLGCLRYCSARSLRTFSGRSRLCSRNYGVRP